MKGSNWITPAFWFSIGVSLVMVVLNISGISSIPWWVVPYPILLVFSGLFLYIMLLMRVTGLIVDGRISRRK
jgi:hypothetical protein